ncbi:hypothetical protein J31TS4_47190 [Paenibacillus sp. J31TS4]|uniref:YhcN/YlaJ family sporulation lipoprotein n=1 Tax=Paenibacillus sp. J31TS4 TaxID=2807195 RepID=UPI001B2CF642|nr:YhcN/YlaJ family sporulation lipoprotein [Paenibacillus sp. J31TS4]GIP41439.1 hypothetical protein J31TS4_47190 [Paenibacillus sp. J31TS4]
MTKNWIRISAATVAGGMLLIASACGYNEYGDKRNNYNYGSTKGASKDEKMSRAYGPRMLGPTLHDNKRLMFSQTLSRRVEAIDGVNSALVMLTDQNAYVAILVDNTATGTIGGSGPRQETNNSGTSLGRYNPETFSQYANPNDLATGINNYWTVSKPENLSHAFKQRIAQTIRAYHPAVVEVHISANREFINQMNMYAQESWKGHPLDGYAEDFNKMVNRLFGGNGNVLPQSARNR